MHRQRSVLGSTNGDEGCGAAEKHGDNASRDLVGARSPSDRQHKALLVLAAASAAMEAFSRALALELAPRRVNTLSPGSIDTPLLAKTLGANRDAVVAAISASHPLHRLGTVAEAGAAVVFLMTNGWMNGATLKVDGGARLV
jgi:NAD(P)-dependent dehydrogenase (short-subunit alcohol dehydrogenase family)